MGVRSICLTCQESPDGCWRAIDCNIQRAHARTAQVACPIGRWERPRFEPYPIPCPVCSLDDPINHGMDHVSALHELAARSMVPPATLQGTGIVYSYVGRGLRDWPMTVVAVKLMREIGITTPIQIWADVWGHELDGVPGVQIIDVDEFAVRHPARYRYRFATKDYALAHCGFKKALWLDTDAYLVRDPAPLFEILDATPFAYWSDFDRNMIQDWSLTGQPRGPIPHQIQGGHILINLEAAWKTVMLSRWYSNHADYWWGKYPWHDESGWCVSLVYAETPFRVVEPAHWERAGFGCYYRDDQYIVHRVRCKLLKGEGRTARGAPYEDRVLELYRALIPPEAPEPQPVRAARIRADRRRVLARR